MNTIDAWLACERNGEQFIFTCEPDQICGIFVIVAGSCWPTHGHDINPGECRPVKLRVEVVG